MFTALKKGMVVRFPYSETSLVSDFRDFRIGRLINIDPLGGELCIESNNPDGPQQYERQLDQVTRAFILADTQVQIQPDRAAATILLNCGNPPEGEFAEYYVLIDGSVRRVSEDQIYFLSHRQDTDPIEQIGRYELHNPAWKKHRDVLIQSYTTLKSETFGLEDLINTRVLLMAHQAEVVARILSDVRCRFILGDEVGLGKTIEACVVLRALRRRYGEFKTLLVVPSALARQWWNELDSKFWLEFAPWRYIKEHPLAPFTQPGLLATVEQLESDKLLQRYIQAQEWGLMIIDEAHHISKSPDLYQFLVDISRKAQRTLVLTATPIQKRTDELFDLLRLMDPTHYDRMGITGFHERLELQRPIREFIVMHLDTLSAELFDIFGFKSDLLRLCNSLSNDRVLASFSEQFAATTALTDAIEIGRAALGYLGENYRIETRLIRNRRATMTREALPQRSVSLDYAYVPGDIEQAALSEAIDYAQTLLQEDLTPLAGEWVRLLLAAISSSPHAALHLIAIRQVALETGIVSNPHPSQLLRPASPHHETNRIQQIAYGINAFTDEHLVLQRFRRATEKWKEYEEVRANDSTFRIAFGSHRIDQIIQSIDSWLQREPAAKILLFTTWVETLTWISEVLSSRYGRQSVERFHVGMNDERLNQAVHSFQESDERKFLICDELGGEGRNLQCADAIIHIDLPWTPAQLEQRIGRVDRIGRKGDVASIIPYAKGQIEADLFDLWHGVFNLFGQTVSGLEIALEDVQLQILSALQEDPQTGIARLQTRLSTTLRDLRRAVDEERALERVAVNDARRHAFRRVSEKFTSGDEFRHAAREWATLAGLKNWYDPAKDEVAFLPKQFNFTSMANAKYVTPPNMEDALRRSQRQNTLEIRGTFNRNIAVKRERLVFFAPGEPWTDSIIANALEADRGRSMAGSISSPLVKESWQGFEFLFAVNVDPQPLYEAGFDPVHLYQAQGFLSVSTYRVFVSRDAKIEKKSHPAVQSILTFPGKPNHLGKRDNRRIDQFRAEYPPDVWQGLIEACSRVARQQVTEEFEFMQEEAEIARQTFAQRLAGERAAMLWINNGQLTTEAENLLSQSEKIAEALIAGIARPRLRLESVGFWMVQPEGSP